MKTIHGHWFHSKTEKSFFFYRTLLNFRTGEELGIYISNLYQKYIKTHEYFSISKKSRKSRLQYFKECQAVSKFHFEGLKFYFEADWSISKKNFKSLELHLKVIEYFKDLELYRTLNNI
ncbi:hypothetical protein RclHR1_14830001 [Rhizophagus clarus]|uniref:Uncharacterized protein n=1 Tax=Rhizophagus clarus TaxID=94130 RepID=A0A2Z6QUF6_9GLOM|nr:hypothetical protein RclHR1_14830001 [Rhizophagus clarus]